MTATDDEDYDDNAETDVEFATDEYMESFDIDITEDDDCEDMETLTVTLTEPDGATDGYALGYPQELTIHIVDQTSTNIASVRGVRALG